MENSKILNSGFIIESRYNTPTAVTSNRRRYAQLLRSRVEKKLRIPKAVAYSSNCF